MAAWQALLEAARPVLAKQSRQRPIGEQPASGLARRAVVALVLGVDDALHRRSTDRAGLLEAAVHAHRLVEGGYLLRERAAGGGAQPFDPRSERRPCRVVKRGDLGLVERTRQLQRRLARGVEDLIRVRIADAAE